jgi:hypothetical protein
MSNLMNENEKLRITARTALDENAKLQHDNEILMDQKKELISPSMKLSADQ